MDPASDIKTARHVWNVFTHIRETWQRLHQVGDLIIHIADLQKRVTELETRLQRCPGEGCPKCGALELRVEKTEQVAAIGDLHKRYMRCGACGFREIWR